MSLNWHVVGGGNQLIIQHVAIQQEVPALCFLLALAPAQSLDHQSSPRTSAQLGVPLVEASIVKMMIRFIILGQLGKHNDAILKEGQLNNSTRYTCDNGSFWPNGGVVTATGYGLAAVGSVVFGWPICCHYSSKSNSSNSDSRNIHSSISDSSNSDISVVTVIRVVIVTVVTVLVVTVVIGTYLTDPV